MKRPVIPTESDISHFRESGFWIAPTLFDDALLEDAREHIERLRRREYEKGEEPLSNYRPSGDADRGLIKIDNGWWSDRIMEQFATSPCLGEIAARLLGAAEIYLWHDQVLYKPGEGGTTGNVGWHQDAGYWKSSSTIDMITAWVAFDDVDEDNGCMRMVAGSNRWGLVDGSDFFDPDMESQRGRMRLPAGSEWREVSMIMNAGQASFHHCLTLHGSGPNRSTRPRRSIAVHMMSGEARLVKGNGHDNERIFGGADGELFRGPKFPRLWPPRD
jgi:ectoine hydroxylase-related dioxygenase (phytanoyl-CoA dioxygenase family)